jgi:hypothetical protein
MLFNYGVDSVATKIEDKKNDIQNNTVPFVVRVSIVTKEKMEKIQCVQRGENIFAYLVNGLKTVCKVISKPVFWFYNNSRLAFWGKNNLA